MFEYTIMLLELKCRAVFSKFMNLTFSDIIGKFEVIHPDNILVNSEYEKKKA